VEKAEKKIEPPLVRPDVNHKLKLVDERISQVSSILGDKLVRRAWEKKEPAAAIQELKKRLLKSSS
jgi:hypothetical protein